MKLRILYLWISLAAVLMLGGCNDDNLPVDLPGPIAMTEEAVGHYCSMNILEHSGPKAQMHLENNKHPIWFSQVRDAIAYLRLPEETVEARATYVHDMSKAASWEAPGDDAWVDINKAYFVLDSKMKGGMGAPETIPFGTMEAAREFTVKNGGKIARLADIPDKYVLGPVEITHKKAGVKQ